MADGGQHISMPFALQLRESCVQGIHKEVSVLHVEAHGRLDSKDTPAQAALADQYPHILQPLPHLCNLCWGRLLRPQPSVIRGPTSSLNQYPCLSWLCVNRTAVPRCVQRGHLSCWPVPEPTRFRLCSQASPCERKQASEPCLVSRVGVRM